LVSNSRRIALASLFGVLILATMGFVPAPTSDYLIVFQSFFLALSLLVVGRGGATYVGLVSGLLITIVKIGFFPYDLVFSLSFGVMVDAFGGAFHAREGPRARTWRLVACMTLSTGIIGLVAYYVTAVSILKLVPNDFLLDFTVLIFGVVSGGIGGAMAARLWNRNLMARFQGS
jgi:RsiW-degrading membrane proteinase PrsW (M82 family)